MPLERPAHYPATQEYPRHSITDRRHRLAAQYRNFNPQSWERKIKGHKRISSPCGISVTGWTYTATENRCRQAGGASVVTTAAF